MRSSIETLLTTEIVTTDEAARILGIHPSAVRQLVMKKSIDCVKKGHTVLLDIEDVHALKSKYL